MHVHSKVFALRKPFSERTEGYAVIVHVLWTDAIFSDSLPLYLLGVVVLETLYSPLYNCSLTVSSDPCQSSVSDEHMYMVGGEKHNTIMTLNNS